jgi:tetratricopeptide (TPR) repeat protein
MVFPQAPRYDVVVPQATGRHKPVLPVPVSAEDFARAQRRVVFKWLGVALVVVLGGVLIYQRLVSSHDSRKALNDGEQMLKTGRYAEAITAFDRALAADRGLAKGYLLRARANAAMDRTEAAIRDFSKVIQLQPGNAGAFVERATVHLGAYEYPAVIADCGEALQRDPNLAYAYTLRGLAWREMGNPARSLEDFNRAVELAPGMETYFQRAATYQSLGEHPKAMADLDQVVSIVPSSPMGYLARARSREAMGDAPGARSDRETGRRLEKRPPDQ